ncbi:anti-sigma-V factor rsiV [Sporosarcina obsidiansis]|uniref:anti-sigma-V factor rsiV n=1 Tax=Sporosarcina obsidiansis TaxID=2660748 RepID=UPI00129A4F94|nr:anti-sigma-V factor rsiV [Sporosarcina obsidiansis]
MKEMDKLKKAYEEIEIPTELKILVEDSIRQATAPKKKRPIIKQWSIGAIAAAALFFVSINVSSTFAQAMVNVPVLGPIVEVFTVQQLTMDEETYQADLSAPAISGLENEELQASLNEKYIDENKTLYKQFEQEVDEMKKAGNGHMGISTGYEVKTDTDQLLSIARYVENIVGSSSTTMKYDTIDKQKNIAITLPSLFKDDTYIDVISSYIKSEMVRQMSVDEEISYFLSDETVPDFEAIRPDQNFYITADHKMMISFDKYEVAPGYMGIVTFEIPSSILKNLLVSDTYIN